MILELTPYGSSNIHKLKKAISDLGLSSVEVPGKPILVTNRNLDPELLPTLAEYFGRAIPVSTAYQLASKAYKNTTTFEVRGVTVGGNHFNTIAGPCSVESEEQIFTTAKYLAEKGVRFIRGGVHKPRTSPYSFRGLGKEGMRLLAEAAKQYDLRIVTEVMDISLLDEVYPYADILQVGSRNMQNFRLLDELGKLNKPVLLKRGMQARATEWLLAAEYILSGGNEQVILCERGIRSFDPDTRNVMDLAVIPLMHELSHLPVFADPSHGTGAASRVIPMALAAVAAGAQGLLIEVHPEPAKALSDAQQALDLPAFGTLMDKLQPLFQLNGAQPDSAGSVLKLQSF